MNKEQYSRLHEVIQLVSPQKMLPPLPLNIMLTLAILLFCLVIVQLNGQSQNLDVSQNMHAEESNLNVQQPVQIELRMLAYNTSAQASSSTGS
jgi:hypothetical protein